MSAGFAGSPLPAVRADAVGHADRLAYAHRLDYDQHNPAAHDHPDNDNHYSTAAGRR
jgi:hypothetical protein